MAQTHLHSFCFALYCFEKIFSAKLLIAKYKNLCSFLQVALMVIMIIEATISYLPNCYLLHLHCSHKVIALYYLFLSDGAIWLN